MDTIARSRIWQLVSPDTAAAAVALCASGFLDKNDLARTFAWLRPNDMTGTTWFDNYLNRLKIRRLLPCIFLELGLDYMPPGCIAIFVKIGMEIPRGMPRQILGAGQPGLPLEGLRGHVLVAVRRTTSQPWPNC